MEHQRDRPTAGGSDLPATIEQGGTNYRLAYALPRVCAQRVVRKFGIYWSDEHRHGVLHPQPTAEEFSAFYDVSTYDQYLSGVSDAVIRHDLMDRILMKVACLFSRPDEDVVKEVLRRKPRPSVCDIGHGAGEFLQHMREGGASVAGVDPSDVSRKALRQKGIESFAGTAESLAGALAGRRFDVITMFHSLEHCLDPQLALQNVRAHLNPDGLAVIEVPNMGCIGARKYFPAWYHTDAGRHVQFFTTESLHRHCRAAGFRRLDTSYAGFINQFTPDWVQAMAAVWDRIYSAGPGPTPRPSRLRTAAYLPSVAFAPPAAKYESVRVYAQA